VDEKTGRLLTKQKNGDQIFYVCNDGKHEFYQVADKEIFLALKSMDAD